MKTVEIIHGVMAYRPGQRVLMSDFKADILIREGKAKLAEHIDNLETKVVTPKKK